MKEIKLNVNFEVDDDANEEDVIEWAKYITGYTSSIKCKNPLVDISINTLGDRDEKVKYYVYCDVSLDNKNLKIYK